MFRVSSSKRTVLRSFTIICTSYSIIAIVAIISSPRRTRWPRVKALSRRYRNLLRSYYGNPRTRGRASWLSSHSLKNFLLRSRRAKRRQSAVKEGGTLRDPRLTPPLSLSLYLHLWDLISHNLADYVARASRLVSFQAWRRSRDSIAVGTIGVIAFRVLAIRLASRK